MGTVKGILRVSSKGCLRDPVDTKSAHRRHVQAIKEALPQQDLIIFVSWKLMVPEKCLSVINLDTTVLVVGVSGKDFSTCTYCIESILGSLELLIYSLHLLLKVICDAWVSQV